MHISRMFQLLSSMLIFLHLSIFSMDSGNRQGQLTVCEKDKKNSKLIQIKERIDQCNELCDKILCMSIALQEKEEEQRDIIDKMISLIKGADCKHVPVQDYDSDSEDEDGYEYKGFKPLKLCRELGSRYLTLGRGIHFSPSKFSKEQRSCMRRTDDAGKSIFSAAAYDCAGERLGGSEKIEGIEHHALQIKALILSLPSEKRNKFQELYSNQYDGFHKKLGKPDANGIFDKFTSQQNPQVSASEAFFHGGKYAAGLKCLGAGIDSLDPEYDEKGKPKHPYLGKIFIILIDKSRIKELDPYFVVWVHANNPDFNISEHYSKNVLVEREVSFPGFIPGECVVFSTAVRVPSFVGEYKSWYETKFGISKRAFNLRKKILTTGHYYKNESRLPEQVREKTAKSLLKKTILPYLEIALKEHVRKECESHGISLVYKSLDDGFCETLPDLSNARSRRERIKKSNV